MRLLQSEDLQLHLSFGDAKDKDEAPGTTPQTSSVMLTRTSFHDVMPITFEGSAHRADMKTRTLNETSTIIDNVLGRSAALDELESKSRAESSRKSALTMHSWNDDTHRLANSILSYRTSVQRVIEGNSFSDGVERHNQSMKIQKIRAYRNEIAKGSWFRRWAKKAEDEIRVLQTVEIELEEEGRREKAKVIRESDRVAGCLAPNGLNMRGKSQRGPFLGYGPLPSSLTRGKDPSSHLKDTHSWDKSGRKSTSGTSGLFSSDPSSKSSLNLMRRAAANITLYKLDLKTIFDSVSNSNDGLIDLEGLIAVFAKLGIQLDPEELTSLCKCFNFRDDGRLSYGEFGWGLFDKRNLVRRWSRSFSRLSKEESLMKFQLIDSFGDGRLSLKGLDRMLATFGMTLSRGMLSCLYEHFETKDARYMDIKAFLLFLESEQQNLGEVSARYVAVYQESQLSRLLRDRNILQRKASLLQSNSPSRPMAL